MIKLIVFLVIVSMELYAILAGDGPYWPRYILEAGLFAALTVSGNWLPGIAGKDGRPVQNVCDRCGRAYPGKFHWCDKED